MTHDNHEHHQDLAERFSQETWDKRYGGSERVWSGRPNPRLVEQVSGLPVGEVLDIGAGEGADTVWLATQGWQVTALDVSPIALQLTRTHADESGVGDLVETLHHDLMNDGPVPGDYDLVSAQFWHPPLDRRPDFDTLIGGAVRSGGTLLVVGHHPDDVHAGIRDVHGHGELLFTPEDIVAVLTPERWDVRLATAQTRPFRSAHGDVTVTDSVVLAVRR
jgi:SAM-dependent methyltransferase